MGRGPGCSPPHSPQRRGCVCCCHQLPHPSSRPCRGPEPLVRSQRGCHLKPEPWAQGSTPRPPVWGLVSPSLCPGLAGARLQGQRGPVVRVLREVVAQTPSPCTGEPWSCAQHAPGVGGVGTLQASPGWGPVGGGPPSDRL